jgi:UDP-N-acetylmuramoyl-tripeptide--D-alanyl-D-alanine ligase
VAGLGEVAEVRPDSCELDDMGRAVLIWKGHRVTLPLAGRHHAENAMIALAATTAAGVDPARAVGALADARPPGGRGTLGQIGELTVIDDTYNANPGSLAKAVEFADWLARHRGRPLAVVVGSMLELGAESDKLHAALAAEIAGRRPALVAAVGEFVPAFEAYRGLLGDGLLTAADAEELGPKLRAALRGDEIVLLKASRGVALERVLRHLQ